MNVHLRPLLVLLLATLYFTSTFAFRQKRLSDTRLAELETKMSLQKLRDERIQKPGFGLRDPHQIGRKRRAPSGLVGILDGREREEEGRPVDIRAWYPGLERLYRISTYPRYPHDQLGLERLAIRLQESPPNADLFPRR